ncbi:MAG: ArnT family glycosyltransferase [bacterium]
MGKLAEFLERRAVLLLIIVIALGVAGYLYNLEGLMMDDGEGIYLYSLWRMSLGEVPYRDFFNPQAPLSFYLGEAVFRLSGGSVFAVRSLTVALTMLTAVLIFLVAVESSDERLPALVASSLFIIDREVYDVGRIFSPEIYLMVFQISGLWTLLRAYRRSRASLCFAAGALWGLGALSKLFAPLFLVGAGLFFLYLWATRRAPIAEVVKWFGALLAGFVAVAGAGFLALALALPESAYGIFGYHLRKETLSFWYVVGRSAKEIALFCRRSPFVVALGGAAAVCASIEGRTRSVLLMCQTATIFILLLLPRPFFGRYFLLISPVLMILSGELLGKLLKARGWSAILGVSVAVALLLGGAAAYYKGPPFQYDRATREIAEYVVKNTAEGEYIVSDYANFAFLARRPMPPRLTDLSTTMTRSGQITARDVIENIERYKVRMVLVHARNGAYHLVELKDYPTLRDYLSVHFVLDREFDRNGQIIEAHILRGER